MTHASKKEEMSAQDLIFEELLKEATKDVVALTSNSTLLNGRFIVRRRLGSGGMGVVYEARDNAHDTRVALKVLSEVNPASIYRLKQEFRALSHVNHANLVGLHELFVDNDIWFFTMDLVVGQSLLAYLNVACDPVTLKTIFLELAEGIHAIHKAGKLHRDLKPNNVLVTPKGHVKILDFGLVSDEEVGGVGQTVLEEAVSGTPTYMAPEQAAGEPSVRATDWYAFGTMLFEVLTGRPPFEDSPHQIVHRKQEESAPRASGICPGIPNDLDMLCRDLLLTDPALRPSYRTVAKILGASPIAASQSLEEQAPFIGRDDELEMLDDAFRAIDEGASVIVFVDGPSGIGKSALIERFLERMERQDNAVILKGRCYERESVPFKAVDSLIDDLTHYLRRLPSQHAARLMPRNVSALARIFPVVNRLEVVRETRERFNLPPNPSELRLIAFSAAKEMLARITSQDPLVICVDDLQWSDVDGVKMLLSLLSSPDPPSMLFIGAYRSEDDASGSGLRLLKGRIAGMRDADIRHIHLSRFSDAESLELAQVLLPKDVTELAPQIAKEAEGSPFFIAELSRFAKVEVSPHKKSHLERAIEQRVSGLSERAKELMGYIAVSGRPIEVSLLEIVMNQGNLSGAIRSLEAFKLIRQTGGIINRVACYHDRIRDTVLSLMDPTLIPGKHRLIAAALEVEKNPDPVALTEHLLGANMFAQAAEMAVKAAHLAEESLAFENAAKFYRIALDLNQLQGGDERRIQIALGESLANAGRGAEAADAYMQAAINTTPEESLNLRCLAAQQWLNTGHIDEGLGELNGVLKAVGYKLHKSNTTAIASIAWHRARLKNVIKRVNQADPRAVTGRQLLELQALESVMLGLWATDTLQAASFCAKYLKCAIDSGNTMAIVKGLSTEAAYRGAEGAKHAQVTETYLRQAEILSEGIDDPETHAFVKLCRGMLRFAQGEVVPAVHYLEQANQYCTEECTRKTTILEMCQAFLGASYCRLGRWADLLRQWDRWVASAVETGNLQHIAVCRIWFMGCVRWLMVDDPAAAHQQLEAALSEWPMPRFDLQRSQALLSRIYLALYESQPHKGFAASKELMDRLYSSYLYRLKLIRVYYTADVIGCALALAAQEKNDPLPLKVAEKLLKKLQAEQTTYGIPFITFYKGSLAHLSGNDDTAITQLKKAASQFEETQYLLHAAAIKRRLGKLMGGDEGRGLIEDGTQVIKDEGIVNPEATTNLLAPGFRF